MVPPIEHPTKVTNRRNRPLACDFAPLKV